MEAAKNLVTAQAELVYELIKAVNNPYILKDKLSKIKVGITGYLYTISMNKDNYGHLGIHPTSSGKDLSRAKHIQYMMNTKNGFVTYAQSVGKRKGQKKLAAFAYDKTNNRLIVASAYETDFFDGLNRLRNTVVIFIIIITLIAIFLMNLIMKNQVLNPIGKIREALDYFANNNFTHEMSEKDLSRGDEIGDIVRSVDTARHEIQAVLNHIIDSSNQILESSEHLI